MISDPRLREAMRAVEAQEAKDMTASETDRLLQERGKVHGKWEDQASTANTLKNAVRTPGWRNLTAMQQEAIDMILVKVSRIVNGNPSHADHWTDIKGYAELGGGIDA